MSQARHSRFVSVVLIIMLCLALFLIPGAAEEAASDRNLAASLAYDADQVMITSIPDDATLLVLAGYQDGRMVFSRFETDLTTLPAAVTLPEGHDAANKLKLYCLDGKFRPVGQEVVVQTALLPEECGVSYYTAPDPEDILTLPDTNTAYIHGELLMVTDLDVDLAYVEALIAPHNGTVLGCMEAFGIYQLGFDQLSSSNDLQTLAELLAQDDHVQSACLHYLTESEVSWIAPSDYEDTWGDLWTTADRASGRNWNLEAIHCPEAWNYIDTTDTIRVGVIDSGFSATHNGLNYARVWENQFDFSDSDEFEDVNHGTHVAGTIAAAWDNEYTCGIVKNTEVYAFSTLSDSNLVQKRDSLFVLQHAMILMATNEAKVVNYSMSHTAPQTHEMNNATLRSIQEEGTVLGDTIVNIVDSGLEILVVQAAGNHSNNNHPRKGAFGATKCNPQGWVDTQWVTAFSHVTQQKARDRILIVGAYVMDNRNGATKYTVSSYSNIGSEVDIIAPGGGYLSMNASDYFGVHSSVGYEYDLMSGSYQRNDDYYSEMHGTSMAAPHVSGVAALVWAVKPDLTGPEVKRILLNNHRQSISVDTGDVLRAVGPIDLDTNGQKTMDYLENPTVDPTVMDQIFTYPMLDAQSAVMAAVYGRDIYTARATVVNNDTGEPIPDAVITLYTQDSNLDEGFQTNDLGQVCEPIDNAFPVSIYAKIEAANYETQTVEVSRSNAGQDYNLGEIRLTPVRTYTISGVVTDGKHPLPDAEYGLLDQWGNNYIVGRKVDSNGAFSLSGIPAGRYKLSVISYAAGLNASVPVQIIDQDVNLASVILLDSNAPVTTLASGSCSSTITWAVTSDGVLTLSGSGTTPDYVFNDETKLPPWREYLSFIKKVVVSEGITQLGWYNFAQCRSLTDVVLPSTLTHLGYGTFVDCDGLKTIVLPDGIRQLGWDVFYNCSNLKYVTLPAGLELVGYHTFYGCTSLTTITIPASLTTIPRNCFKNCIYLEKVYFLGDAPNITSTAFDNTSSWLEFYYLPTAAGWTNSEWTCNGVTYSTCIWYS